MKTLKLISLGFCFLCLSFSTLLAQSIDLESDSDVMNKYLKTITVEELKAHLYTLASDDFEGRETGQLGQKLAADYIARAFMDNALVGPVKENPNPFFQPIQFRGRIVGDVTLKSENASLDYGKDFISRSLSDIELSGADLVFAGYGIEKENYNDYADIDVKGKGVVIIDGEPRDGDGNSLMSDVPSVYRRLRGLTQKGAKFALVAYPDEETADNRLSFWKATMNKPHLSLGKEKGRLSSMPYMLVSPKAVARLFGEEPSKYHKTINKRLKKNQPLGGLFEAKVDLVYQLKDRPVVSENVLGYMEGTDLKDELLVITAHYDHDGIKGAEIYNGADDDGSGTVGVLEIANAFATAAKDGYRPRRSILFMTVTGEEKGLLGSKYYTENPIFPLAKTVTNLNIDMIGRVDPAHESAGDYVYIIGSNMLSSDLDGIHKQISKQYFPDFMMDYKYNTKDDPNRFYYRSDHYNFAKNNIPIIFYFNGTHEDYHQPGDTPDKINYEMLAKRAQLVFATAWEIANRDEAPRVDKADTGVSGSK